MTNSQRLTAVRAHLRQWLSEHCDSFLPVQENGEPTRITESMVIRDEHYCGRCFHAAEHRAIWFIEEDQLKIFDDSGVVAVFQGDEIGGEAPRPNVIRMEPNRETTDDQDVRRAA
ncbi:MAG: hypothetical protein WBD20_19705 [Pirellulaceae bacterium]